VLTLVAPALHGCEPALALRAPVLARRSARVELGRAPFGGYQRWVVGLVTGGGSQLPLPWSVGAGAGAGCCCAAAGAAPARTVATVSTNHSLVMALSSAQGCKGNIARRDEVPHVPLRR
jgi:hypothetical protein